MACWGLDWESGVEVGWGFPLFHFLRAYLSIWAQLEGQFGLWYRWARGGGSSVTLVSAAVTRDSNSESPTCIGGGLGIRVGWSPELGGGSLGLGSRNDLWEGGQVMKVMCRGRGVEPSPGNFVWARQSWQLMG